MAIALQLNSALFDMHVTMEDHVHDEPKFFDASVHEPSAIAAVVNKFLREHPESRTKIERDHDRCCGRSMALSLNFFTATSPRSKARAANVVACVVGVAARP